MLRWPRRILCVCLNYALMCILSLFKKLYYWRLPCCKNKSNRHDLQEGRFILAQEFWGFSLWSLRPMCQHHCKGYMGQRWTTYFLDDSETEKRKVHALKIPSLTPMYVYRAQMDNYLFSIYSLDLGSILLPLGSTPSQLPSPWKKYKHFLLLHSQPPGYMSLYICV